MLHKQMENMRTAHFSYSYYYVYYCYNKFRKFVYEHFGCLLYSIVWQRVQIVNILCLSMLCLLCIDDLSLCDKIIFSGHYYCFHPALFKECINMRGGVKLHRSNFFSTVNKFMIIKLGSKMVVQFLFDEKLH